MPKPVGAPIQITLYGEGDEVLGEYSRMFVPVRIFKTALQLANDLGDLSRLDDVSKIDPDLIEKLAGLVAAVFGNQFSAADVMDHSDIVEMITVLRMIMSRVQGIGSNPTAPGRQ